MSAAAEVVAIDIRRVGTAQVRDIAASMTETHESVSERLEPLIARVVLDLNTAKHVVQRVGDVSGNRLR